ncbi:MAG TPA: prolyl oligopeptidase family serine peptidase [Acidobacteriota bacterium]|mgnify:FL=1|nr:hypothetical protein [Acidobacteriota bacterium]HJO30709.1 prolyl oligopeptidase family serine peptidase [Acidobacteriota bacterium]|tara:strand:+ start:5308 stop:7926 length:2619 start_codon:yes stop_codon:yes gene_type:complete
MHGHLPTLRSVGIVALAFLLVPAVALNAQQEDAENHAPEDPRLVLLNTEAYLMPPSEVLDAVMATQDQPLRMQNPDPTGQMFMRAVSDGFPALAMFAKRHYDLGQFQIDPAANRNRRFTTRSSVGIELYTADGQLATAIQIPDGARVTGQRWSPDSSQVAFFANFDDATHIYVASAQSGQSRRITNTAVLATHVAAFNWTADGSRIITVLLPANRGPEPPMPEIPETPKVRVTTPDRNRLRTYFDLLETPYEKELVYYYSTGQLASIDVDSGDTELIGGPAMLRSVSASPDGEYFRVTTIKDDLSYIVPVSSAGTVEEIWDADGSALALIDDEDVNEQAQGNNGGGRGQRSGSNGANDDDKRSLAWRTDGGPGMVFLQLEARPEADDDAEEEEAEEESEEREPRKDRVMYWLPPFGDDDTELVYETEERIQSARFDESGRLMFLTRRDGSDETVHAVSLDDPTQEYLIYEEDTDDRTADMGTLVGSAKPGAVRLSPDGQFVYLSGTQYYEDPLAEAPRPFVDKVGIFSGNKERIFQSSPDMFETMGTPLDDSLAEVIISRESATIVPNQWRVNLETGSETQITFNQDRHPRITSARRERFTINRADGFESRVTVTLPTGYSDGTRLPAMFWFYPREYSEQEAYDEGFQTFNKNRFPNVGARSMSVLTLLGYALVEPDVPIVGPEGQRNDEYPHDLRNTLAATIDEIVERGWVDRNRLGIGGHSYGAFGTANAMIQTPFFKAGIAGDGNYNRSLTPAGFQSERRYLWEAQDLYIEMSPFFQADRLSGNLLMYHGMDDHNVGTHPIHADRMFHALEVLGKTASMYKYPFEDHGPATYETTLDLWARWVAWLDLYVMNPEGQETSTNNGGSSSGK